MAAAIMVSTFGCVNGLILSGARVSFAMARDGLFFRGLARFNARGGPGQRALGAGRLGEPARAVGKLQPAAQVRDLGGHALLRPARRRRHRPAPQAARAAAAVPRAGLSVCCQLLYAAAALALIVLLLAGNPATTWPGYALVPPGCRSYFLWRKTAMTRAAARDVRDGVVLVEYPEASDEEANRAAVALGAALRRRAARSARRGSRGADPARLLRSARLGARASAAGDRARGPRPAPPEAPPVVSSGFRSPTAAEDLGRARAAPRAGCRGVRAAARGGASTASPFSGSRRAFAYLSGLAPELARAAAGDARVRACRGPRRDRRALHRHLSRRDAGRLATDRPHLACGSSIRGAIRPPFCSPGDRVRFEPCGPRTFRRRRRGRRRARRLPASRLCA